MKELISIDEVCKIANISVPTVYRRLKVGNFPKPKKVPSKAARGRKKVNRWERGEVIRWLLKGNDPKWIKQPITHKELFGKEALQLDDAARLAEGATDIYDFEPVEEPPKTKLYIALIGALLAGIAVMLFT